VISGKGFTLQAICEKDILVHTILEGQVGCVIVRAFSDDKAS
jgi:hypothetical protein